MRQSGLGIGCLALLGVATLAFGASGCEMVRVSLVIPGFDSGRIEGVTFWRREPGGFVEDGRLMFEGVEFRGAHEILSYRFRPCHGAPSRLAFRSRIQRSVTDPDVVVVELLYPRRERPGVFRLSTFNAVGESPMTDAAAHL